MHKELYISTTERVLIQSDEPFEQLKCLPFVLNKISYSVYLGIERNNITLLTEKGQIEAEWNLIHEYSMGI